MGINIEKKTGRAKCRAAGNTGASGGCRTGPKVWFASSTSPYELKLTASGSGITSQAQTEAEVSHWLQAAAQIQVETSLLSKAECLSAGHTAPSRKKGGQGVQGADCEAKALFYVCQRCFQETRATRL